jgi:hypothetical protein
MHRRREFPDAEVDSWLEQEIASCRFDDVRHGKRIGVLLEHLSEQIGGSIPFANRSMIKSIATPGLLPSSDPLSPASVRRGRVG